MRIIGRPGWWTSKYTFLDFDNYRAPGPGRSVKSPLFKLMGTVITIGNERPGQGLRSLYKGCSGFIDIY